MVLRHTPRAVTPFGWLSVFVEFLKEALAKLERREGIRRVCAETGFFAEELLSYLEELKPGYIVVARVLHTIVAYHLLNNHLDRSFSLTYQVLGVPRRQFSGYR